MVGCAMRTKMPTGRYLHGAHGAPYFDKTLNLLALGLTVDNILNWRLVNLHVPVNGYPVQVHCYPER